MGTSLPPLILVNLHVLIGVKTKHTCIPASNLGRLSEIYFSCTAPHVLAYAAGMNMDGVIRLKVLPGLDKPDRMRALFFASACTSRAFFLETIFHNLLTKIGTPSLYLSLHARKLGESWTMKRL